MNSPDKTLNELIDVLEHDFPGLSILLSEKSYWDPQNRTIFINPSQLNPTWSLMHEIGHMKLNHTQYKFDVELVLLETQAWSESRKISPQYGINIDTEYIEDCLDSYRDWLHRRSLCPECGLNGIQDNSLAYNCLNCANKWRVGKSRFCRAYRMKIKNQPH